MSSIHPPSPATVPVFRCGVGSCLNVDRNGDRIVIYQSDHPETKVVLTVAEYNAFVAAAKPIIT